MLLKKIVKNYKWIRVAWFCYYHS